MSRSLRAVLPLLLITGCKGCEDTEELPHLFEELDATPTAVWVGEGLGVSPLKVPLYAVNSVGAPVPAGDLTVTSEASVSGTATPDSLGWAEAEVTASTPGTFAVTGDVSGLSGTGAAWVVAAEPGTLNAPGVQLPGVATELAAAGGGVAAAIGTEVWWAAPGGAPPVRVLALAEPVVQLLSVHLDNDGIADLVTITTSQMLVLRGRDGGGLGWAGGWDAAEGRSFVGVAASDVDGDGSVDISVALDTGSGTMLGQLGGDGSWDFTPIDALELDYHVYGISTEDLDANGVGEITLLTEDGFLRRYTKFDDSWASTLSGTQYDLELGAGGRMLPSTDLTGDGIAELVAYGPSYDGAGWKGWVVTAGSSDPTQFRVLDLPDAEWAGMALAELDGDGVSDYVLVSSERLGRGIWSGKNFSAINLVDAPVAPPLAVLDLDGDGTNDVVSGEDTLRVYYGDVSEDDPTTKKVDESNPWTVRSPDVSNFATHLVLEPAVGDVTGDGIVDLVGVVSASGVGASLQGFLGSVATKSANETIYSGGTVSLTTTGSALDLAVCGTTAWVLYEETDDTGALGTWLVQATLGSGMGPTLSGSPVAVSASQVVCGDFSSGEVAVVDAAGDVSYVDNTGTVLDGENVGTTVAAAAVDTNGDGLSEVVACGEADCFVGSADMDADGYEDLVVQDSTGVTVTTASASYTLATTATARISDADGDGAGDLVLGDNGAASVVRLVAGGLTPSETSWVWRPVQGAVFFGDLDGDGLPDAFFLGEDRDTTDDDTAWVGVTLYAHAE